MVCCSWDCFFFFFHLPDTTTIYSLSLPDAFQSVGRSSNRGLDGFLVRALAEQSSANARTRKPSRSEEHTSELQSHSDIVCRLLLEKKKQKKKTIERRRATKASARLDTLHDTSTD